MSGRRRVQQHSFPPVGSRRTQCQAFGALTVLKLRPAAFAFSTAVGSSFPRAPPREIVSFAAAHRLPAVYGVRDFVSDGGLMSYDANIKDIWCRAAFYIDKKELRFLEKLQEFLSPFQLPRILSVKVEGCDGNPDASYENDMPTAPMAQLFGDMVEQAHLPKERADDCKDEYLQVALAYEKLIGPHIDHVIAKELFDKSWLPDATIRVPSRATQPK